MKKSKRCFNCNQQTNGIFNPAKEIIAKLKMADGAGEDENAGSDNNGENGSDEKDGDSIIIE